MLIEHRLARPAPYLAPAEWVQLVSNSVLEDAELTADLAGPRVDHGKADEKGAQRARACVPGDPARMTISACNRSAARGDIEISSLPDILPVLDSNWEAAWRLI